LVETILDDHPQYHIIIGGDLNTELKGKSPFDLQWDALMLSHNLECCDNLTENLGPTTCTYRHDSLQQSKWSDHFLVGKDFVPSTSNHRILDEGGNVSDHLPILMDFSVNLSQGNPKEYPVTKPPTLKWD
jgi:endonuclease/exonuclease/phosphatase family metal-dependent hydrolase